MNEPVYEKPTATIIPFGQDDVICSSNGDMGDPLDPDSKFWGL